MKRLRMRFWLGLTRFWADFTDTSEQDAMLDDYYRELR